MVRLVGSHYVKTGLCVSVGLLTVNVYLNTDKVAQHTEEGCQHAMD